MATRPKKPATGADKTPTPRRSANPNPGQKPADKGDPAGEGVVDDSRNDPAGDEPPLGSAAEATMGATIPQVVDEEAQRVHDKAVADELGREEVREEVAKKRGPGRPKGTGKKPKNAAEAVAEEKRSKLPLRKWRVSYVASSKGALPRTRIVEAVSQDTAIPLAHRLNGIKDTHRYNVQVVPEPDDAT